MTEWATRRVRACNVNIGDELSWFDTKAMKEKTMVVVATDHGFPGFVQFQVRYKRNGKRRYQWNTKHSTLMRVRRGLK